MHEYFPDSIICYHTHSTVALLIYKKKNKGYTLTSFQTLYKKGCEISHKPSSVLSNHLSRLTVTNKLKRRTQRRDGQPLKCLSIRSCSKWGLHSREVAITLVSSYLTFPPLPELPQAVYLCCTFLQVTLTGRYPAPCPVELGLSSPRSSLAAIARLTRKTYIIILL